MEPAVHAVPERGINGTEHRDIQCQVEERGKEKVELDTAFHAQVLYDPRENVQDLDGKIVRRLVEVIINDMHLLDRVLEKLPRDRFQGVQYVTLAHALEFFG